MRGLLTWKTEASRVFFSIGIALFWPVFVAAAARLEKPSSKAAAMIATIETNPPRLITLDEYHAIGHGLKWHDRRFIEEAMEKRGYLVSMATTANGDVVPARCSVASEIGQPIVLTEHGSGEWTFRTSPQSWKYLAGRAGNAIVEDGVIVSVRNSMMN